MPNYFRLKFIIFIILLSAMSISANEWLNNFIIYSDDGKTLIDFPRFHEGRFEIPDGVEEIAEKAFYNCRYLTEIVIPDSVLVIGKEAFAECTSLESIKIPNSVEIIGFNTFYRCDNLKTIEIPESIKEIDQYAFNECGLKSIVIRGTDVKLASQFAYNCYYLEYVDIRYATNIGINAFYNCYSLEQVLLPRGIDHSQIFFGCYPTVTLFDENETEESIEEYDFLRWISAEDGLSVRSEPSLDGEWIELIDHGTAVTIIEEDDKLVRIHGTSGYWTYIDYATGEGWVFGGFISDITTHDSNNNDIKDEISIQKIIPPYSISITDDQIRGEWFVIYENGNLVSQGGTEEPSLNNYKPNTGSWGLSFQFDDERNFAFDNIDLDKDYSYELENNIIYISSDSSTQRYNPRISTRNYDYSFKVEMIDKTHIQITNLENDEWYVCALFDEHLVKIIKEDTLGSFIYYIQQNGHLNSIFSSEETLLMLAVKYGNLAITEWLINNSNIDINRTNIYGMSALHYAMQYSANNSSIEIVEILIENGAYLNIVDNYGQTPLDYSLYDWPRSIQNREIRILLAEAGGKSSRKSWARHMNYQDFF